MSVDPAAVHMDNMYRHQRLIYDATRAYYLLGRDQMISGLGAGPSSSVLEVACGTARNLMHVARSYPDARLFGFDISSEMLATARASVRRRGLGRRIRLELGDATAFSSAKIFGLTSPDRIFVSYALSMIPRWEAVIETALAQLAPGGSLHIVDFGNMDGMPAPAKRALVAWLAKFDVTPRLDLETVCATAAARHGMCCSFSQSPRRYWALAVIRRS